MENDVPVLVQDRSLTKYVTVLVVDDHALVAETLVSSLSIIPDFKVMAVQNVQSALDLIMQQGPFSIVLLDYDMPSSDPMQSMNKLMTANGGGVAIFSGVAKRYMIERALLAGAVGFVPKTIHLKSLQHAIRLMADGEVFVPSEFLRPNAGDKTQAGGLKPAEVEVLTLLAAGKANKEIGRELDLDETTVKMHVRALFRKLGATNRTQVALEAQSRGIC
jgi:two-component system nitrate/nitrite response regulator NarL